MAWMRPAVAARMTDSDATRLAAAADVTVRPLSSHYAGRTRRQGLILGYAGFPEDAIDAAMARLAHALS